MWWKDRITTMAAAISLVLLSACGDSAAKAEEETPADSLEMRYIEVPGKDSVLVTVNTDSMRVYSEVAKKENCFILISKRDLRLYVYETGKADTILRAHYPVCLGKAKGNKEKRGDMRTPESPSNKPFEITKIQNASYWTHDFKDGRGAIKSYGNWFLRLLTPGHSGIGIHGSTNNENTVPGRASEGCIRLRDADIIHLKETYAFVGMKVIIKAEDEGYLPFEPETIKILSNKH